MQTYPGRTRRALAGAILAWSVTTAAQAPAPPEGAQAAPADERAEPLRIKIEHNLLQLALMEQRIALARAELERATMQLQQIAPKLQEARTVITAEAEKAHPGKTIDWAAGGTLIAKATTATTPLGQPVPPPPTSPQPQQPRPE